jgi:hypothetical protein
MNVVYPMANDDLLQQIDKLIQKRLDEAVDPIHERLDTQREQISNVEKNLRQEIKDSEKNLRQDIKESEKNIVEQYSPITNLVLDHDEKIAELQKAVGLPPKH